MEYIMTMELMERYQRSLYEEEKSKLTIEKYMRDIRKFFNFLETNRRVDKMRVIAYKDYLKEHYQASSVNSMLVALNRFLEFAGWMECRVRQLKIQKTLFCKKEKYLTQQEYERLVKTAMQEGDIQLSVLMQTICSTGIRVSELPYITVSSLKTGYAQISNKGKNRIIFLPRPLLKLLSLYSKRNQIKRGSIFVTRTGKPLSRSTIWKKMKQICCAARVDEQKVFPHNLRHLFAFTFYRLEKNLLRLAEVLGHSNIETTRIYTMSTGEEHRNLISKLGLVLDRGRKGT